MELATVMPNAGLDWKVIFRELGNYDYVLHRYLRRTVGVAARALAVRRCGAVAARDGMPLLLGGMYAFIQRLRGCWQAGGRADKPIRSINWLLCNRPKQRCGPVCGREYWHKCTNVRPHRRHDKAKIRHSARPEPRARGTVARTGVHHETSYRTGRAIRMVSILSRCPRRCGRGVSAFASTATTA
jgi:hypothetical protein